MERSTALGEDVGEFHVEDAVWRLSSAKPGHGPMDRQRTAASHIKKDIILL